MDIGGCQEASGEVQWPAWRSRAGEDIERPVEEAATVVVAVAVMVVVIVEVVMSSGGSGIDGVVINIAISTTMATEKDGGFWC